ncbi:hypothetical protein HUJ04_011202 [Dendroctonus ponderosae]|nr:hypothetical protein HUJ04_011202 [Dendroctonus ponderosae]
MRESTMFCHLDITDAYIHMSVDEGFAEALKLNTLGHGLIRPRRAVYSCANIPAKWQHTFTNLITSLERVLRKLNESGIKVNKKKCIFTASPVEFLDKHITSVRDAPKPMSHDELELFLGKTTYYNGCIPNLATVSRPLRYIRSTPEGEQAYTNLKQILISPQVLTTYDPAKKLILATDASKVGLGAVWN